MDHASLYLDNQHNNQSNSAVMCCCGKRCKGYKGLKIHQRSCKFIFGLREDLTTTLLDHVVESHERPGYSEAEELNNSNQSESHTSDHSNVKNGLKLPKTSDQWATAELPTHEIGKDNLELITQKLSDTIYDYFDREFGSVVNTSDTEFKVKCKDFSKCQLREALKTLKSSNLENNVTEIGFVSKLLRSKISSTSTNKNFDNNETDHNKSFGSGFWSYCKKYIDHMGHMTPSYKLKPCSNDTYAQKRYCRGPGKFQANNS